MARRSRLSRFIYASIYFILYVVVLGLILITPGDIIEHSVDHRQHFNIWILAVAYIVTTLVVCFVYVLRLYINKTALTSIPKGWVPVGEGDVKASVHRMIYAGLGRSAAVSHAARPAQQDVVIEHYGWSSPASPDLPNLQYAGVLAEVPNLIEAKALTLPRNMDPALQRSPRASLREYVAHLAQMGVLAMDDAVEEFLARYEHARFSTRPISNGQFRDIMHLFADILRGMHCEESDIDDDRPASTHSAHSSVRRPLRERSSYRTAPDTRPYTSSASLRSDASESVIRLSTGEDDTDLPYVLSLRDTGGSGY